MRKVINTTHLSGYVFDHKLELRVTGENSKNPGTEYIRGELDIVTDEQGLNVVPVKFTYVTEFTKKGTKNETFAALKSIIDSDRTVAKVGKDNAIIVRVDTSLGLNEFYTNRNGDTTLVSAKQNDGGFVHIDTKLESADKRNTFTVDMLINGTRFVEADEEKKISEDYLVIKGAVFDSFRGSMMPVELSVKSSGGIKYFESLEPSVQNPVFIKVWGSVRSENIVTRVEEEAGFGEANVKEYTRNVKEWVITGAAKELYEIVNDGEEGDLTPSEIKKMMQDRETKLATLKKDFDDRQSASTTSGFATAPTVGVTAQAGGFNF